MPILPFKLCGRPGCPNMIRGARFCPAHADTSKLTQRRPCATSGCPNLVLIDQRVCADCEAEEAKKYDEYRGNARARGYDRKWEKTRQAYLAAHPLCEECERRGQVVPAVMVHHKVELSQGGDRLAPENLEALCLACHRRRHPRGRGQG